MTSQLHSLFVHTAPDIPLTAELFRYTVANGIRELDMRYVICRDSVGSVYRGIREKQTAFGESATPLISAITWDVPNRQFRLCSRGDKERMFDFDS
jgi:hypothetical protein